MSTTSEDRFVVTLRPVPPGADRFGRTAAYRLRRALKVLFRRFGLRCVSVEETLSAAPSASAGGRQVSEPSPVTADIHRSGQPGAGVNR